MNLENRKQIATILLAVGLGLVAAFLTSQYIKTSVEQQTRLIAEDFKKQNDTQKAEFIKQLELRDREIGKRMAAMASQQKELIDKQIKLSSRQSAPSPAAGRAAEVVDTTVFSSMTPPGKRAVTIMIDSLSAVGGLINPGDFVDIIAQLKISKEGGESEDAKEITSVIFQDLQVLAVGANFRPVGNAALYQQQQQSRSLNVTLAVSPQEASLLTFAQNNGKLQLALRSPVEKGTNTLEVAAWDTLSEYVLDNQGTKLEIKKPREKPAPQVFEAGESEEEYEPYIEIFRGGREL